MFRCEIPGRMERRLDWTVPSQMHQSAPDTQPCYGGCHNLLSICKISPSSIPCRRKLGESHDIYELTHANTYALPGHQTS